MKKSFDVSIVMPAHNEAASIEEVLSEWVKVLKNQNINFEIVVAEDGSTDGTLYILRKMSHKLPMSINTSSKRRSYGEAVIAGAKTAKSKYLLFVDSGGQCDPQDFEKFWIARSQFDAVVGWRRKRMDTLGRKIYSGAFKIIFNLLFQVHIHDPSAPYVLVKKYEFLKMEDLLRLMKEGFWWGFAGSCVLRKFKVKEIDINHRERMAGGTKVYTLANIPGISARNLTGLIKLRVAKIS